jgi:hypothetical protein
MDKVKENENESNLLDDLKLDGNTESDPKGFKF